MTRDDIASAVTPIVRAGLSAGAGFLAARGFTGATDLVSSFTAAGVTLVATVAWALVEKSKLLQMIFSEVPISSLEEVANTVSKLRASGGDPLLIAHIAQAVTALANQELAAAQPHLVPAAPVPQPAAAAEPPSPPTVVAPAVETAPPVAAPVASSLPGDVSTGAAASTSSAGGGVIVSQSAPILADGSLPA